ncbi:hypothetical protein BDZ89DRAFT_1073259 [Hymenopellis radicata]|nr:hypothetical protein BDZ89DRAFT_1073259 [Hymenopellis radicata]
MADSQRIPRLPSYPLGRDRCPRASPPIFNTVMLVSLKAGGTGLNLAACNNVIIMDPWFNPAVEEQAVNRVHRIGQDKTVHIYKVIIPGTIEDKILEMQRKKQEIADRVLSASEVLAQKLLSELWGQPILSY